MTLAMSVHLPLSFFKKVKHKLIRRDQFIDEKSKKLKLTRELPASCMDMTDES